MHCLVLKVVTSNSSYGQSKKWLIFVKIAFGFLKIDTSWNMDLSISLERALEELLNGLSILKLWTVK